MASLKANLEGKKIAKKMMEFMDNQSFGPVYDEIEKSEDPHAYISEIMRCIPTGAMIDHLDERGELYEAYKEYADMNGRDILKDTVKGVSIKEKLQLVSELFGIPYLASPEEYGDMIAKAVKEQYYR